MKSLHLILYRKWFIQIFKGEKKEEYRDKTDFWKKQLFNEDGKPKHYDVINFRNGYRKDALEMKVECLGIEEREEKYVILLGNVLDSKRCEEL